MDGDQVATLAPSIKLVGVWVAAILTLMVYSHLINDNPLSRLAEHLFVGTAVGYTIVLAYHSVLWPKLIQPLLTDPLNNWPLLILATLAVLLLLRPIPFLRPLASLPLGVIVGVGTALALAGAVAGSLLPQTGATMLSVDPAQAAELFINSLLIVLGVISTILFFYFTAKRTGIPGTALRTIGFIGKVTMLLTFGAVFASTITARLALLVGRAQFLLGDWLGLVK